MGIVFGKTGVSEPAFDVVLSRATASFPYEIRRYGKRFAIEAEYTGDEINKGFRLLAGYIGVGSAPQNDGGTSIAMTAPVVTAAGDKPKGKPIAMTAPVVTKAEPDSGNLVKKMQFILPAEYDDMSKIPKPTNQQVSVTEVPAAVGAVHRFSGWVKEAKAKGKVSDLVRQLEEDGLDGISEENAHNTYQLWQYNPPFTIPQLRRNEVFIDLTEDQVQEHVKRFSGKDDS